MTAPTPEPLTEAQRREIAPWNHRLLEATVARLIADATAALRAELDADRAKVARVESVHANAGDGWCLGCDADWPCRTWDALRGDS